MKFSFIIISFFTILLSSCDTERIVHTNSIPTSTNLVLNGIVYANNDTSYFHITESRPIYRDTATLGNDNKSGYSIIKDATFSLTINGTTNYPEYDHIDSAYVFIGHLKEGDKINIQAGHKDLVIKSMATLPSAPKVTSVDTTSFQRIENGLLKKYLMFKLTIKDKPESTDYYRLLVQDKYTNSWNDNIISSNSYYTDDPVLKDGYTGEINNQNINWVASRYNHYSVFRDVRFSNQEYTLTFYVDSFSLYDKPTEEKEEQTQYIPKRHLSISLQSISEDLYRYYSSLQRNLQMHDDKVTEPVIVHTNIRGGLGILGACNEIKVFEYKNY